MAPNDDYQGGSRLFLGSTRTHILVIYLSNMTIEGRLRRPRPVQIRAATRLAQPEYRSRGALGRPEHPSFVRVRTCPRARAGARLVDEFLHPMPYQVMTEISPGTWDGMPATNIITIGSDKHNSVTRYCLRLDPYLELDKKNRCVQVLKGPNKGQVLRRDTTGSLAVLERIRVADGGPVIFCCVGEHSVSSWQIAEYLAYNWQYLYKQWGIALLRSASNMASRHS